MRSVSGTGATLLAIFLAGLVSGCGEVAFKRGAGTGDLAGAARRCRAGDPAAYRTCMAAAGWSVGELGTTEGPSPATPVPAARPAVPDSASAAAPAPAPSLPAAAPIPAAPEGPRLVSSWWKLGGTAGGLDAARAACGVGAPAVPVPPAALACMAGKGWHGVGTKG